MNRTQNPLLMRENLEVDITLDAHVGSIDVSSINGHIHVGSPGVILPFDVEVVVGLEVGRQGTVVSNTALPLNREISVAVNSRGDTVVIINLLRDSDLLVLSRGSELDASLISAVVNDNVRLFRLHVVTRVDRHACSVLVKALGGLNSLDTEIIASRGGKADRNVIFLVGGVNVKVGMVALLSIHLGAGRDTVEG